MAEVKVKTITYDNLPEELKEDPKILRFPYKKPFKEEIEEFKREQEIESMDICFKETEEGKLIPCKGMDI